MPDREGVQITFGTLTVPESRLQELFEPLFTAKREGTSGLGLSIAAKMIERHGGSIEIRSSSQQGRSGSSLSVFLPNVPVDV